MSIYSLGTFQISNYDSWIIITNQINNVCVSIVKDESRKAAGNGIDLLTKGGNQDNFEFSHDELTFKYVCID